MFASEEDVSEDIAESADTLASQFGAALPRLGVAFSIVVAGYVLARILRVVVRSLLSHRQTPSFAEVMSRLVSWVFLGVVTGAALAITFPSVQPVDLLAGLGFFSVAVGFAFQDILENTLAGVLLLFRQPFVSGDQIGVDGNEGVVEAITIRETRIRQYDGQLLVVPNRDVYKSAIRVQTSQADRRVEFTVGVSYDSDLTSARRVILDALDPIDAIRFEPEPSALLAGLGASAIDFEVRFWVGADQADALVATDQAIQRVKEALDEAGIEMPATIVQVVGEPTQGLLGGRPGNP